MTNQLAWEQYLDSQRVSLAALPTRITEAVNLRESLGGAARCPRIFIKHDEETGVALGGNKARKLEYLLWRARECRAIITIGELHSNHAVMTAAAACRLGKRPILVLTTSEREPISQGNYLLMQSFCRTEDIHLLYMGPDAPFPDVGKYVARLEQRLISEGTSYYSIPVGGSSAVGVLGYVKFTVEFVNQIAEQDLKPTRLYYACGSRGTQAGLELGKRLLPHAPYNLYGIAVSGGEEEKRRNAARIANGAGALLGVDVNIQSQSIITNRDYIGEGFGKPTRESLEAAKMAAECEGLLLDGSYTAKAMAALIGDVRSGALGPKESIVFLHTGAAGSLFVN
jgi:1-aminocyclopropane-1-carboxylate deaminase/D-cysteine desulfhydrase-like pyridoxal-dependent ACC family enzyme